jgi:hypothetical protein
LYLNGSYTVSDTTAWIMADIFLSYSSADKSIVASIAAILSARGWSVWWDHQIPIGQRFDNVIEAELQSAKCVVVIWTKRAVASEWVKNEANFAASKGILVPLMLEEVQLPINFSRIEAALLMNWKGEADHPELINFLQSVEATVSGSKNHAVIPDPVLPDDNHIMHRGPITAFWQRPVVIAVFLFAVIASAAFFLWPREQNVIVKVVDYKRNPVTSGEVKIALKEYVRTQSIDREGQALFTKIPPDELKIDRLIEVASPGYVVLRVDTMLQYGKPIQLVLPYSSVVMIRGKVKTAAELPIAGVEITVEGTRYYALSQTDGSFDLRLEEYTIGDEIKISTTHKDYQDKTFSVTLSAPEMLKQDIFLSPAAP